MVDLATTPPPPTKEPMRGIVRRAAAEPGGEITVEVLAFSNVYVFEVDRYEARGMALPAAGDECLVLEDERGEPWVPVWWPATPTPGAGSVSEAGAVTGGSGFTAERTATGVYKVKLAAPLAAPAAIFVQVNSAIRLWRVPTVSSKQEWEVLLYDKTEAAANAAFAFHLAYLGQG